MNVLITGAGGLLGRCMTRSFLTAGHRVTETRHTARTAADLTLDITDEAACLARVSQVKPDWIINCAAQRNPDRCVTLPQEAYALNALGVEYLARVANATGAGLCHISSDYVFSGSKPPYNEEDAPHPLILYGRTKLGGEFAARSAYRHLVIRIPALYRLDVNDPANVVTHFANTLRAGRQLELDAESARYYTQADEVAAAVVFLTTRDTQGIIHLSAQQRSTKADFALGIAAVFGLDQTLIRKLIPDPTVRDRPMDTHLSTTKYEAMGGPGFTGVQTALAGLGRA